MYRFYDENTNTYQVKGHTIILQQEISDVLAFENLKCLEIFASKSIQLDIDVILPGIDLIISSPLWIIEKAIIIDLSGKDGMKGEAKELDGLPGKPGQNGGNFFGNGSKVDQKGKLTIRANGGNGGKGGDGVKGQDGVNGKDGNLADVDERKETCLVKREKLKFNDGKTEFIVESLLTFNDRFESQYTSWGTPGQDGENGGKAGGGGLGGYPGTIEVIGFEDNLQFDCENKKGIEGEAGNPGAPGKGGSGGVTYTRTYLESKAFSSFRKDYKEDAIAKLKSNVSERVPTKCDDSDSDDENMNLKENLKGKVTAPIVTATMTAGNVVAQKTAQKLAYQAGAEISKEFSKQMLKEGTKTLSKEAAQELGKEVAKQITMKVGEETIKKAGGTVLKDSVTSVVTGTIGGSLQGAVAKESVRQISRGSVSGLKNAASAAGSGAFSLSSTFFSLGASLLVQGVASIATEYLRQGWKGEVEVINEKSGENGKIVEEINIDGREQPKEKIASSAYQKRPT